MQFIARTLSGTGSHRPQAARLPKVDVRDAGGMPSNRARVSLARQQRGAEEERRRGKTAAEGHMGMLRAAGSTHTTTGGSHTSTTSSDKDRSSTTSRLGATTATATTTTTIFPTIKSTSTRPSSGVPTPYTMTTTTAISVPTTAVLDYMGWGAPCWGNRLRLVGDLPALGSGVPSHAPEFDFVAATDSWHLTLELPVGSPFSCSLVSVDECLKDPPVWEQTPRRLILPAVQSGWGVALDLRWDQPMQNRLEVLQQQQEQQQPWQSGLELVPLLHQEQQQQQWQFGLGALARTSTNISTSKTSNSKYGRVTDFGEGFKVALCRREQPQQQGEQKQQHTQQCKEQQEEAGQQPPIAVQRPTTVQPPTSVGGVVGGVTTGGVAQGLQSGELPFAPVAAGDAGAGAAGANGAVVPSQVADLLEQLKGIGLRMTLLAALLAAGSTAAAANAGDVEGAGAKADEATAAGATAQGGAGAGAAAAAAAQAAAAAVSAGGDGSGNGNEDGGCSRALGWPGTSMAQ